MKTLRFVALCALAALSRHGLSQELSAYTPLEQERWMQDEQPLKLKIFGGVNYDSNLFRLSAEANPQTTIGTSDKSDIIYQLGAGGKYELRQSRQKFIAEATVTQNQFQNFDSLNNTSSDLRGAWQWHVGNDWNGDLGAGNRRFLQSFVNLQQNVRDMINQDRLYGSANYLLHSHLKLTLDADWYDTQHGAQSQQSLDSKTRDTAFTVNWITPAQNTVGLKYRTQSAHYPNNEAVSGTSVNNDYTEDEYSVVAHWKASGASDVIARIGHTQRQFDQSPNRNFSDLTWQLTYIWQPTGKTALELATWRDLSAFQDLTANYARVTGISLVPTWSLSSQFALRGRVSWQTYNFVGNPGIVAPTTDQRVDKVRLYQISGLWTPLRLTELALTLESGKRTSNRAFVDYKYNSIGVLATRYF